MVIVGENTELAFFGIFAHIEHSESSYSFVNVLNNGTHEVPQM